MMYKIFLPIRTLKHICQLLVLSAEMIFSTHFSATKIPTPPNPDVSPDQRVQEFSHRPTVNDIFYPHTTLPLTTPSLKVPVALFLTTILDMTLKFSGLKQKFYCRMPCLTQTFFSKQNR